MDVFGLVGNPVGHSLSPPMHEAAFEARELDATYVTFEPDESDLSAAIEGAAALGIEGLNVTIPFKEAVLELVTPTETARRIGAVNTIDLTGPRATGYNTDAAGARRALAHHDVSLAGSDVVILGAGGAARAVAFAVAERAERLRIANRTTERAVDLAEAVGASGHGLDEAADLLEEADLLVNATSVGMREDRSPVPADALHEDLVVMDAVYAPLSTRLLQDAEGVGATTIDGGWMLLYQGVEAFEIWTGLDAPVDEMNQALRTALERQ
ncbi:MAG: shikimate dehydrogenase [Halodesulfurarchaeum sp.]